MNDLRCMTCPLIGKSPSVQGSGPSDAVIMFVGEAPEADDAAAGIPFVGRSGKLLDFCIEKAGGKRKDVFVTNTVMCRPPDNRMPTDEEVAACGIKLDEEIASVKPKLIVTLGAVALRRVAKLNAIGKARGNPVKRDGRLILPTYHPAAVLRNRDHMPAFQEDIRAAFALAESIAEGKRGKYRAMTTVREVAWLVGKLREAGTYSVDLETTGLDPFRDSVIGVAFSWMNGSGAYVPFEAPDWTPPHGYLPEVKSLLREPLEAKGRTRVMHGGGFDVAFLRRAGFRLADYQFDTMLAHHLVDENKDHDLKSLSKRYPDMAGYELELDEAKKAVKRHPGEGYGRIPLDVMTRYAGADADVTLRLHGDLTEDLKRERLLRLFERLTMPLRHELTEAQMRGVLIDKEQLDKIRADYLSRAAEMEKEVREHVGDINLDSSKQLNDALFGRLKLKPVRFSKKTRAPSTDKMALSLMLEQHSVIKSLLDYRKASKVYSTFLKEGAGLSKTFEGRIHTEYKIHGTRTGRLSSSGPNLQNIPRDAGLRSAFMASSGYRLVTADYNQMEFRILADYCKDEKLLALYQEDDGDMHMEVACALFGKRPEDITSEERAVAKVVNFGTIYGMGPEAMMLSLWERSRISKSVDECAGLRRRLFSRFIGIPTFVSYVKEVVKREKRLVNRFGRVRRLPHIMSYEDGISAYAERQGVNFLVSGTAADITSISTIRVGERIRREALDAHLVLTVHDELVYECAEKDVARLYCVIEEETVGRGFKGITVPLKMDIDDGDRWMKLEKKVA